MKKMDTIRDNIRQFINKYVIIIILLFALLTLLPYVSAFKPLQVANTAGVIYRGILLGFIGLFFLFVICIYKTRLPIYVWVYSGIYLISQIVTIFISPIIKNTTIPILTTIMGLGQAVITIISTITYLTIHKDSEFDNKIINDVCLFMIFFGLFLCLYSYIFEYQDIYNTFNTIYGWNYDVTSIFITKTEYGFVLFICSIFSIFYVLNNKKYWMYCVPIFFLINMFISRSKTSILCTTLILATIFVIHIIQSWNKYRKNWIISFVCLGMAIITLIVLIVLKIGWFEKLNYFIAQVIFGDAKVVIEDRIHKWSLLIQAINNPFNIIFGYGERITPLILSDCGCATIGDNIYLSTYGVGGIIKLLAYLLLILSIIVTDFKKNNCLIKKIIVLITQLSFLIGGLFEDDSVVGITMSALFSSIVFFFFFKMIKIDLLND